MIGTIVVWVSFIAALLSVWGYFQNVRRRKDTLRLARRSFHVMVLGVMFSSFLLLMFILQHRFEYAYVYGYSSRDLPLHYLLSTFYAGQEGSFLFWALASAIIGVFLLNYARRKQIEKEVMPVYIGIQAFLLLLLIAKSPFQSIWDAYPGQIAAGTIPPDGRGLNPLLQDFWMTIHPPVLFLGFAAMAVPFSFAMAGLWRRNYQDWLTSSFPWVVFAVLSLGAGIMLGGYWAYGVLGWGGWWGWDPVENSSLIPWILAVALLHTILVQRRTGNLARTNFVLVILSFVLVIYSTFLTRSGVLGSASVHSFTDPGSFAYTLLLLWMATITLGGVGLLMKRWKELSPLAGKLGLFTKESFITVASMIMGASAIIIFFGTSWPIVANSTVEPAFYNKMNLPIGILLVLILGLSLMLRWQEASGKELLKRSVFSLGASAAVLIALIAVGLRDLGMAALAFCSLFAFFVNVKNAYYLVRENPRLLGGPLAHVGLALLFLGIIGSGYYGRKETAALPLNDTKEVLGYNVTYLGAQPTEDGKWKFLIKAQNEREEFTLQPVMYHSTYNDNVMRNPDYVSFFTKDFYIEPVSLESGGEHTHAQDVYELTKGQPQTIEDMKVTFVRFDMNAHGKETMMTGGGFLVGAVLEVERGKTKEVITPATIYQENAQPQAETAMLKDGKIGFQMLSMNVDPEAKASRIQVNVVGLHEHAATESNPELLVIEASLKPFIGLVWFGTVFVLVGLFFSIRRRSKEITSGEELLSVRKLHRGNDSGKKTHGKKESAVETV